MFDKDCEINTFKDICTLKDNAKVVEVAHILFAGKTNKEIGEICERLHILIMLAKTYIK